MLWAAARRAPGLTFLSIVIAFLLFGLLQSLGGAFKAGVRLAADDLLPDDLQARLTRLLPLAYASRIAAIDGAAVRRSGNVSSAAKLQDPKNQAAAIAVDPRTVRQAR